MIRRSMGQCRECKVSRGLIHANLYKNDRKIERLAGVHTFWNFDVDAKVESSELFQGDILKRETLHLTKTEDVGWLQRDHLPRHALPLASALFSKRGWGAI